MARTAEGRRLTDAHRKAQVRLGGIAAAMTAANAKRLDIEDLDGSGPRWVAAQVAIIEAMRAQSALLAADYVRKFRRAEGLAPVDVATPELPPAIDSVSWVIPTIKARMTRYAGKSG